VLSPAHNSEYAVPLRSTQIGRWPTSHIRGTLSAIPRQDKENKKWILE